MTAIEELLANCQLMDGSIHTIGNRETALIGVGVIRTSKSIWFQVD